MAAEYEVEVLEGLVALAREELEETGVAVLQAHDDGLRVRADGPAALLGARLASAVYLRLAFEVPRPKALLGDAHFRRLRAAVERVAADGRFRGFRFAAAGADSSVFRRLGAALARATGLRFDPDEGELVVRVRPVPGGEGWEALVRLTPRPSSARDWRVCNRAGGLNACLAAAMVRLTGVRRGDRYLNLMCGSGTLLVERTLAGPAREITGVDVDEEALSCARENLEAAGVGGACRLLKADVRSAALPLGGPPGAAAPDPGAAGAGYDVIVADLPWGDAVGSHADNRTLHPAVLDAADHLGTADVRVALLTHELRLFRRVLAEQDRWRVDADLQVAHGGHHPHLYLLRRA